VNIRKQQADSEKPQPDTTKRKKGDLKNRLVEIC
jgi:hypothetical protein